MSSPVLATLGKYQLVRKLATGGMAEVYLAKVAGPGGFEKTLVLKRVLPHLASDETFIAMFLSEAKLAAQLNHPNVVSIFDFGQEGETWFLVMEYIDGPNLRSLYKRAFELQQPPAFNLAAKIISHACEGLAYAHEFADPETGEPMGLVHRDISPDNILLGRNGGVKVVDFGIAKAAKQSHHTKTGTIKGKFSYMPPEQLRGTGLDRRVDVFALGIVLYELISGTKPFDSSTDATIMQSILFEPFVPAIVHRPQTPPELQRIIDRALEKDVSKRYADCREMQTELDHFIVTQGASVGQHQLAQLVARLANSTIPALATPSPKPSQPNLPRASAPMPSAPRQQEDATIPSMPTPAPTASHPMARSYELPTVPLRPAAAISKQEAVVPKSRVGRILGVGSGALVLLAGSYAWVSSKPAADPVEVPKVEAEPVPPAQMPTLAAPTPAPEPIAAVDPIQPIAAKNQRTPKTKKSPPPAKAEPAKVESGLVDFRVRPYASVFVDGTFIGVTPLGKVKLTPGVHTVKLVNKDIGKEISLEFEVQPGENTLKYNLETQ